MSLSVASGEHTELWTGGVQACTLAYMNNINLSIPEELLASVDRARGDVPRTVWIRRAIEQRLADPIQEVRAAWDEAEFPIRCPSSDYKRMQDALRNLDA